MRNESPMLNGGTRSGRGYMGGSRELSYEDSFDVEDDWMEPPPSNVRERGRAGTGEGSRRGRGGIGEGGEGRGREEREGGRGGREGGGERRGKERIEREG